jgi:GT2 family glycosyltransferase
VSAMSTSDGISIVIPSWNGRRLLERFLPSVIEATACFLQREGTSAEVIVVDDGSEDDSVSWLASRSFVEICRGLPDDQTKRERLNPTTKNRSREAQVDADGQNEERIPDVVLRATPSQTAAIMPSAGKTADLKVIRNPRNSGFGFSCNRGFDEAKHRLVMLVNNDVELDQGCLDILAENFSDPFVFAAHCRVIDMTSGEECGTGKLGSFARGFIRVHRSYVPRPAVAQGQKHTPPLYSMFASGGSAMFDREKFLELGGFDPVLAPFYWEDVELSYRAWKRGYQIVYEPRAVARHQISSTISQIEPSRVRRIQQRNRLLYHWVHLHDRRMFASHLIWVAVLVVTVPLRLQPSFWLAFGAALKVLPDVGRRRKKEKVKSKRSDREVFRIFERLQERSDLIAYDQRSELPKSD